MRPMWRWKKCHLVALNTFICGKIKNIHQFKKSLNVAEINSDNLHNPQSLTKHLLEYDFFLDKPYRGTFYKVSYVGKGGGTRFLLFITSLGTCIS